MSNVHPDDRFSPADRAAATRCLCEALAMESGNEIPAHHRAAYTRSAAGAIGCTLQDLRACEQTVLIGLCDEFAATGRGELRVCILSDEPDKAARPRHTRGDRLMTHDPRRHGALRDTNAVP